MLCSTDFISRNDSSGSRGDSVNNNSSHEMVCVSGRDTFHACN